MSAVKIFALGVLLTGTLTASTPAGSTREADSSPDSAPQQKTAAVPAGRTIAAENVAGNWNGSGSQPVGLTLGTTGGNTNAGSSLVLGTSQSSSPINFGGASFRIANSVSGATSSQASPTPSQPPMSLSSFANGAGQSSPPPSQSGNSGAPADAFINFGNAPFAEASSLTTGNPQSFANSPAFSNLFGSGGPTSQDVSKFEDKVLSTVQQTYNQAGLPIRLTSDPNTPAAHMLSVVSQASNPQSPNAIGITDVGNNGYSFIDKFAGASDPSQLATAIGHNVAHELMHAFGLANHPETSGPYVDAATTTLSNLSDPNTDFSPAASSLLSTLNFQATGQSVTAGNGNQLIDGDQILLSGAAPVPEPSTIAFWTLAALTGVAYRRRKSA